MEAVILKRTSGKEYASITHEEDNKLIFLNWTGFLSKDLVMAGSEELLEVIKETKCEKVLVNNQDVTGPWQSANEWYETNWNPRAAKEGLKTMAVIMSDNIFTQISLQGFEKITQGVYTVGIFNNDADARKWLSEN